MGVMGAVNKGVRAHGGEIIGVIHKKFCVDTDEDKLITNMIKTDGNDLNERKDLLLSNRYR
jgi:predicted Rossmann-fold nucleotide-binding protein